MPTELEKMLAGEVTTPRRAGATPPARERPVLDLQRHRESEQTQRRRLLTRIQQTDCWLGAGLVAPASKSGSRSVIGAGSIVTKDVPEGVLAVGNPCRVLREIRHDE